VGRADAGRRVEGWGGDARTLQAGSRVVVILCDTVAGLVRVVEQLICRAVASSLLGINSGVNRALIAKPAYDVVPSGAFALI